MFTSVKETVTTGERRTERKREREKTKLQTTERKVEISPLANLNGYTPPLPAFFLALPPSQLNFVYFARYWFLISKPEV